LCILGGRVYHSDMDGKELQRRRIALGMSVQDLAELLDVTRVSLHRWERDGVSERVGMLHLALLALEMAQLVGALGVDQEGG